MLYAHWNSGSLPDQLAPAFSMPALVTAQANGYGQAMDGMVELFHSSFSVVNLPATLLLILVLVYWVTVLIGALDVEAFDFDMPDVDFDGDVDVDAGSSFEGFLEFFNIRYVPLSFFISIMVLALWALSITLNTLIHQNTDLLWGAGLFLVNLSLSLLLTKFFCLPFIPVFKQFRDYASSHFSLLGEEVVVTSSKVDEAFGQAEYRGNGPELALNVRCQGEEIPKGAKARVTKYIKDQNLYVITMKEKTHAAD